MAIAKSFVKFARYLGKDVAAKLPLQYLLTVDIASSQVRNNSLTPNGGIIQISQDVFSDSGSETFNYCAYIIGGKTYYGWAKMVQSANRVVTYSITVDPLTTCYYGGCLNQNCLIEFCANGDETRPDPRRTRAIDKSVRTYTYGNMRDISGGMVAMSVYSEFNWSNPSGTPGITTYFFTPLGFTGFLSRYRLLLTPQAQAAYSKSILSVKFAPLSYGDVGGQLSPTEHITLVNPATDGFERYTEIDSINAFYLGNSSGQPLTLYTAIMNRLETGTKTDPAKRDMEYRAHFGCFGDVTFSADEIETEVTSIQGKILFNADNLRYKLVPIINGLEYYKYSVNGCITGSIPIGTESDSTNYSLQQSIASNAMLRKSETAGVSYANSVDSAELSYSRGIRAALYGSAGQIVGGISNMVGGNAGGFGGVVGGVAGGIETYASAKDAYDTSLRIAGRNRGAESEHAFGEYLDSVSALKNQEMFSGGVVTSGDGGDGWRALESYYLTTTYTPYIDEAFPAAYGKPLYKVENIQYASDLSARKGYIKTSCCSLPLNGYDVDIVSNAEKILDTGAFLS